ncbi:hypothetical protein [Pedobacter sp. KLB.chiD]|uniref:hypothetical protein n=1 Tax=Pedobacter sp. KLB.chiD TaxID=3387402 RepID=UPI003999E751
MKTTQNKIWMRFLLLGISFYLTAVNVNCGKRSVDYVQYAQYEFINKTQYSIKVIESRSPDISFKIDKGSTYSLLREQDGSDKIVTEQSYISPFFSSQVIIEFDNTRCLNMTSQSEKSVFNLENYSSIRMNSRKYKFTYTFTEQDYDRAVACQ